MWVYDISLQITPRERVIRDRKGRKWKKEFGWDEEKKEKGQTIRAIRTAIGRVSAVGSHENVQWTCVT